MHLIIDMLDSGVNAFLCLRVEDACQHEYWITYFKLFWPPSLVEKYTWDKDNKVNMKIIHHVHRNKPLSMITL